MDFSQLEQSLGLPAGILDAVMQTESGGNPRAVSPKGALGAFQIMPATARDLGVNPFDVGQAAQGAAQYLKQNLDKFGSVRAAIAAYNAGPGNVAKAGGQVPDIKETQDYVKKVESKLPALNPDSVQWDDAGSAPQAAQGAPDPSTVQWDDAKAPAPQASSGPVAGDTTPAGWKPLGGFLTGIGDFAKGATRAIVHGGASIANTIAPDSQFTKDINAAIPQIDATMQGQDQAYAAQRAAQGGSGVDLARMAGQVAPALAIPAGADTLLGNLGMGAASGAVQGAAMTGPGQSYGHNALVGGAAGVAGAGLASVAGKVIGGLKPSANAQLLIDKGVVPTPGQLVGGAANTMEEKAASIPFAGEAVASARRASINDMNKALYKDILEPIGETAPTTVGRDAVGDVGDKLSARYQNLLPQVSFTPDSQFMSDLRGIAQDVSSLPPDIRTRFSAIIDRNFTSQLKNGQMDGDALKQVESAIGKHASDLKGSSDTFQRDMGGALNDVQTSLRDALARQNPQQAPELQAINQAYSRYSILRDAAARVNDPGKPIMPGQLQAAVNQADNTVGRGNFAKGLARGQDMSDAAMDVLGSKYPDSGTAARIGLYGILGGLTHINPIAGAAGITASGLYGTKLGRQVMLAALTSRPDIFRSLGAGLQSVSPQVGGAAGVLSGSR